MTNAATVPLTSSSDELLVRTIDLLIHTRSYPVFAAFIRLGAVRRWIMEELKLSAEEFTAALVDLDNRQADLLPEKIDDIAPKTQKRLRAIFEFVKVQLRKKGLDGMVRAIFRNRPLAAPGESFQATTVPEPRDDAHGAAELPRQWKLKLPIPPAHEELQKVSPTRLDSYLRCPFTFFLSRKEVLGDKRLQDSVVKLAGWEFGNVVHGALENWGLSELRDSTDSKAIAAFLENAVERQLAERFGESVPSAVISQGEDAKQRLAAFAERQVRHRAEGWKIESIERKLEMTIGHTLVYGKCDRIDVNEQTGERLVIDYKAWNSAENIVRIGGESLQLPLYCAMLGPLVGKLARGYWVLPPVAREQSSLSIVRGKDLSAAVKQTGEVIELIERGIFWPPSPRCEWKHNFEDWLGPAPEQSVDEDWIADQILRKEKLSNGA